LWARVVAPLDSDRAIGLHHALRLRGTWHPVLAECRQDSNGATPGMSSHAKLRGARVSVPWLRYVRSRPREPSDDPPAAWWHRES